MFMHLKKIYLYFISKFHHISQLGGIYYYLDLVDLRSAHLSRKALISHSINTMPINFLLSNVIFDLRNPQSRETLTSLPGSSRIYPSTILQILHSRILWLTGSIVNFIC